jgi:hypothetical protein
MACRSWPTFRQGNRLFEILRDQALIDYYAKFFTRAFDKQGDVDYWDYQWLYACWSQGGFSVSPNKTLVSNIGWGPDATHTFGEPDRRAYLPAEEMEFPLKHPPAVVRDEKMDQRFLREVVLPCVPRPETLYQELRRRTAELVPEKLRASLATARGRLGFLKHSKVS